MNWFKNLFKSRQKSFYPASKTVFLITEYKALGDTDTKELKVLESQAGFYVEQGFNIFVLRKGGKLEPQDEYRRWLPKSGWSFDELKNLDMITEKDYKFNNL